MLTLPTSNKKPRSSSKNPFMDPEEKLMVKNDTELF
jgi:hypothetical protein